MCVGGGDKQYLNIAPNFLNSQEIIDPQNQEVGLNTPQKIHYKENTIKKNTPRFIIIKFLKSIDKESNLEAASGN